MEETCLPKDEGTPKRLVAESSINLLVQEAARAFRRDYYDQVVNSGAEAVDGTPVPSRLAWGGP